MQQVADKRVLLGVPVSVFSRQQAVAFLDDAVSQRKHVKVAFANAHALTIAAHNRDLRDSLKEFCVFNDGLGVDIASRIMFGHRFPDNLNGTDFIPYYLTRSQHGLRIYLLGGTPEVVETAAAWFRSQYPRHEIVGMHQGYISDKDDAGICADISAAQADIVLVSMGNPIQERWIARNAEATDARVLLGVGALLDFVSGRVPRAPQWVRTLRCEWIYRLVLEPKRLWRRYLIGNVVFLASVLRDRLTTVGVENTPSVR